MEADEANEDEEAGEEEPTIPSKVKTGEIPSTVPANKIVHVTKLPKKCKQVDVVEAFAKYGAIDQIHIVTTPGGTVANVAYKTEKAATAALEANKKVKVLDSLIWVTKYAKSSDKKQKTKINESRERSVYVRYLKAGTTEDQLRAHFEGCGEMERVKLVNKFNTTFGFVTFTDTSSKEAALKLHNSVLNDVNIGVCENNENPTQVGQLYDEKLTVMVKNKQSFECVEVAKLESIFSKCGEIESMDIVCKKNVLAFITYKTEQAAQKALKLNGKTEQGIELESELYNPFNKKTAIYISNLPKECTEEDLTKCFSRAGEITNIVHKGGYAIIRFVDSDAYCKSFLFNESFIKKQMIFVEPHSIRKKAVMKSKIPKNFQKKGFKRPAENGNSVFKPKKAKNN
ncbi:DNA-binding protein modulo [Calliphora vicina]|uniref:DNA-binding protein modulo n=1 Tax=Calliphora vicina TaxID=7373 RepID=UPI00325A5F5B